MLSKLCFIEIAFPHILIFKKVNYIYVNSYFFVDKLSEIDTEGVEPLIYLSDEVNILRDDKIGEVVTQEQALKNAPNK